MNTSDTTGVQPLSDIPPMSQTKSFLKAMAIPIRDSGIVLRGSHFFVLKLYSSVEDINLHNKGRRTTSSCFAHDFGQQKHTCHHVPCRRRQTPFRQRQSMHDRPWERSCLGASPMLLSGCSWQRWFLWQPFPLIFSNRLNSHLLESVSD